MKIIEKYKGVPKCLKDIDPGELFAWKGTTGMRRVGGEDRVHDIELILMNSGEISWWDRYTEVYPLTGTLTVERMQSHD